VPAALRSQLGKSLRSAPDEPLRATVAGAVHHGSGHRADRLLTFGDAVEIADRVATTANKLRAIDVAGRRARGVCTVPARVSQSRSGEKRP
jgi:hypothetical protein